VERGTSHAMADKHSLGTFGDVAGMTTCPAYLKLPRT
jgi:hypothetical protein